MYVCYHVINLSFQNVKKDKTENRFTNSQRNKDEKRMNQNPNIRMKIKKYPLEIEIIINRHRKQVKVETNN